MLENESALKTQAQLKWLFVTSRCLSRALSEPATHHFPLCPQQQGITLVLTFVPILRDLAVSSVTPADLQATPAKTITIKQSSKPQPAADHFLALCAKALKACPGGQSAIHCGGQALLQDHGSLVYLGKIAAATGAFLICGNAFPCINRGAGLPDFQVCDCHLAAFAVVVFKCISPIFIVIQMHALECP